MNSTCYLPVCILCYVKQMRPLVPYSHIDRNRHKQFTFTSGSGYVGMRFILLVAQAYTSCPCPEVGPENK